MQDTLTFESIKSFKYYDKSKDSFLFNQKKAALIGAFSGFIVGFLSEPESIEWAILGSILWGGIGAINGSIYGLLIPRESEILILGDKEWQIVK